jgi:hypothetical protein
MSITWGVDIQNRLHVLKVERPGATVSYRDGVLAFRSEYTSTINHIVAEERSRRTAVARATRGSALMDAERAKMITGMNKRFRDGAYVLLKASEPKGGSTAPGPVVSHPHDPSKEEHIRYEITQTNFMTQKFTDGTFDTYLEKAIELEEDHDSIKRQKTDDAKVAVGSVASETSGRQTIRTSHYDTYKDWEQTRELPLVVDGPAGPLPAVSKEEKHQYREIHNAHKDTTETTTTMTSFLGGGYQVVAGGYQIKSLPGVFYGTSLNGSLKPFDAKLYAEMLTTTARRAGRPSFATNRALALLGIQLEDANQATDDLMVDSADPALDHTATRERTAVELLGAFSQTMNDIRDTLYRPMNPPSTYHSWKLIVNTDGGADSVIVHVNNLGEGTELNKTGERKYTVKASRASGRSRNIVYTFSKQASGQADKTFCEVAVGAEGATAAEQEILTAKDPTVQCSLFMLPRGGGFEFEGVVFDILQHTESNEVEYASAFGQRCRVGASASAPRVMVAWSGSMPIATLADENGFLQNVQVSELNHEIHTGFTKSQAAVMYAAITAPLQTGTLADEDIMLGAVGILTTTNELAEASYDDCLPVEPELTFDLHPVNPHNVFPRRGTKMILRFGTYILPQNQFVWCCGTTPSVRLDAIEAVLAYVHSVEQRGSSETDTTAYVPLNYAYLKRTARNKLNHQTMQMAGAQRAYADNEIRYLLEQGKEMMEDYADVPQLPQLATFVFDTASILLGSYFNTGFKNTPQLLTTLRAFMRDIQAAAVKEDYDDMFTSIQGEQDAAGLAANVVKEFESDILAIADTVESRTRFIEICFEALKHNQSTAVERSLTDFKDNIDTAVKEIETEISNHHLTEWFKGLITVVDAPAKWVAILDAHKSDRRMHQVKETMSTYATMLTKLTAEQHASFHALVLAIHPAPKVVPFARATRTAPASESIATDLYQIEGRIDTFGDDHAFLRAQYNDIKTNIETAMGDAERNSQRYKTNIHSTDSDSTIANQQRDNDANYTAFKKFVSDAEKIANASTNLQKKLTPDIRKQMFKTAAAAEAFVRTSDAFAIKINKKRDAIHDHDALNDGKYEARKRALNAQKHRAETTRMGKLSSWERLASRYQSTEGRLAQSQMTTAQTFFITNGKKLQDFMTKMNAYIAKTQQRILDAAAPYPKTNHTDTIAHFEDKLATTGDLDTAIKKYNTTLRPQLKAYLDIMHRVYQTEWQATNLPDADTAAKMQFFKTSAQDSLAPVARPTRTKLIVLTERFDQFAMIMQDLNGVDFQNPQSLVEERAHVVSHVIDTALNRVSSDWSGSDRTTTMANLEKIMETLTTRVAVAGAKTNAYDTARRLVKAYREIPSDVRIQHEYSVSARRAEEEYTTAISNATSDDISATQTKADQIEEAVKNREEALNNRAARITALLPQIGFPLLRNAMAATGQKTDTVAEEMQRMKSDADDASAKALHYANWALDALADSNLRELDRSESNDQKITNTVAAQWMADTAARHGIDVPLDASVVGNTQTTDGDDRALADHALYVATVAYNDSVTAHQEHLVRVNNLKTELVTLKQDMASKTHQLTDYKLTIAVLTETYKWFQRINTPSDEIKADMATIIQTKHDQEMFADHDDLPNTIADLRNKIATKERELTTVEHDSPPSTAPAAIAVQTATRNDTALAASVVLAPEAQKEIFQRYTRLLQQTLGELNDASSAQIKEITRVSESLAAFKHRTDVASHDDFKSYFMQWMDFTFPDHTKSSVKTHLRKTRNSRQAVFDAISNLNNNDDDASEGWGDWYTLWNGTTKLKPLTLDPQIAEWFVTFPLPLVSRDLQARSFAFELEFPSTADNNTDNNNAEYELMCMLGQFVKEHDAKINTDSLMNLDEEIQTTFTRLTGVAIERPSTDDEAKAVVSRVDGLFKLTHGAGFNDLTLLHTADMATKQLADAEDALEYTKQLIADAETTLGDPNLDEAEVSKARAEIARLNKKIRGPQEDASDSDSESEADSTDDGGF